MDQAYELKAGIGSLFDSKKKLGMRETFLSAESAELLGLGVGDEVVMRYDVPLLLNTIQMLGDQILPSILVKGVTVE